MSFDKSLRLLNYAKSELGGYLELYTELDHDFVVGDIVYIIGGYYDNTNELLYINNYSSGTPTKYNPFAIHKHGYKILFIDYTKNSFVIDFQVNPLNIIYPYGTDSNKFGDPQDNVNLAYNTFVSNDMYKDIYVSRTCFIKGRFNKGTINNGVFGNDKQKAIIGKHPDMVAFSNTTDITINHIGGKNLLLTSGVINSKTDTANPTSKKIELVEDLTISPVNPFAIANIAINNNNDGFGYNTFENFINVGNIIINNGVFDNPYDKDIVINNATINKFLFGSKEPMYNHGCVINDVVINNSTVYNKSTVNLITLNNTVYDTYIDLNIISLSWGINPGDIELNVDYNVLANKIWNNENVYISGIIPPDNSFSIFNIDLYGDIISTTYTFGDLNSAVIVINCPNLIANWSSILLTNPNTYDLSNTRINFINRDASDLYVKSNNTIYAHCNGTNLFVDNNNTIVIGKYNSATFTNNVNITGINIGLNVYLSNSYQIVTSTNIPTFNYAYLKNNTPITANINKSKIIGGVIYNSTISNTHADPAIGFDIYLDNVILYNGSKIESDVLWNDVNIQFYGDIVSGVTYINNSYLGDRKTPWKTEKTGLTPLTPLSKSSEINKTTGTRGNDISYYTSQHKIENIIGPSIAPIYNVTYEVPNLLNVQVPINTSKKMTIIDNGIMTYLSGAWYMLANQIKKPLFVGILDNYLTLKNKINARTTNTLSGTYSDFTGVALPPANVSNITHVDDNWVIEQSNHYYPTESRTQRDISINVYDIIPTPATFPDPLNNTPESLMFLRLDANTGPDIDSIYDDNVTPTLIHNAIYTLYFRQPGVFNNSAMGIATNIPACFIEIEQVKIIKKDLLNVVQSANIYYSNYCPSFTGTAGGAEYAWDNIKTVSSYPTDYKILHNSTNDITFEMTSTDKFEIVVEYWITWFYNETTLNLTLENNPYLKTNYKGGYRTKHMLRHKFEPSNETYFILGESSDELVDHSGNNIVWI